MSGEQGSARVEPHLSTNSIPVDLVRLIVLSKVLVSGVMGLL